jgi:predicted nucleic acid-binding protein
VTVFIDTSAIYAVLNRRDANHAGAKEAWERLLRGGTTLYTTNYVLLETGALLQRRVGLEALRVLRDDVQPIIAVDWISERAHQAGMDAVLTAGRRKLSLVDCVSFHVMRERGVRAVFCFDDHFREQGFDVIP